MGGYGSGRPTTYLPALTSLPIQLRSQDDHSHEILKLQEKLQQTQPIGRKDSLLRVHPSLSLSLIYSKSIEGGSVCPWQHEDAKPWRPGFESQLVDRAEILRALFFLLFGLKVSGKKAERRVYHGALLSLTLHRAHVSYAFASFTVLGIGLYKQVLPLKCLLID